MTIPYGKHKIDSKDLKFVQKSLKSELITQGPLVKKFEINLKNKVKSKYCVAVNSATSALHISCLALNINKKKFGVDSSKHICFDIKFSIILWC